MLLYFAAADAAFRRCRLLRAAAAFFFADVFVF